MSDDSTPVVEYRGLDFMGYKGYRVGNDGSVWSRRCGGGWGVWRKLKPSKSKYSYRLVGIYDFYSKLKSHRVAPLILLAFVGPRPDKMQCCHSGGDKSNDAFSNLRWDTPKANAADKERHGTALRGSSIGNSKLTEQEVIQIKKGWADGRTLQSVADEYNVTKQMIWLIDKSKWWRHVKDGS